MDTKTRFITKGKAMYNGKYDYTNIIFVDYDTPVKIRCTEHGIFEITPKLHLGHRTGKCPECIWSKICRDRELIGVEPLYHQDFVKHWSQISKMT